MLTFVAIPIWIAQGFLALLGVTLGRKTFFQQKDRSKMTFTDPFPVEHQFLTVNGLRLHAVSAGHGRGKPLMLCLHGFPELWFSWRQQLKEFQDDYEVVAIDMRGYGESDRPKSRRAYDLSELTSDVSEVIKALGHKECVLVAHDWGAFVAWFTAALYPAAVQKLVIMGLPHPTAWKVNLDFNQMRRSWYFMFFQCPWLPEFMLTAQDVALFDGCFRSGPIAPRNKGAVSDEDIERYKQAFQQPGAPTAAINYYRALIDCATWHNNPAFRKASKALAEGKLPMPVLMLYADSDTALGTQLVKGTDRFVKDLELHVLENCSHWVQQDKPAEVHRLMRGFLKRTEPAVAVGAAAA
ncbi:hypothetical protein CVIRNUC_008149 [Coccomyxa viridis]|uniref:AB hydrolase-1 domain-containing protein n=1 Tax=Coccomyxa viridis TaxID=1274662 RepID=A0AAV1ID15_9CHLO|nr:hypothetical protein CVIRNUC_008149 [Coccomyxa viridis]